MTKVTLFGRHKSNRKANSHLFKDDSNLNNAEEYNDATIKVFLGNYSGDANGFDEWVGAAMTVETGHLEKGQIALEKKGYSTDPNTPEFKRVYEPLLNKAVTYRIKYRDEHNLPLDKDVFRALDLYAIPYNEYNRKRRDEYESK